MSADTKRKVPDSVVRVLFVSLLIEQVLDLHSTLTAPAHRTEVNPAILWVAGHVGIPVALLFIKSMAVLVIVALSRVWKQSGGHQNRIYALVLLALNFEYCVVVMNNYIS
jgi:hypothetical protein